MSAYWFMRFGAGPQAEAAAALPETFWLEPFTALEGNLRDYEVKPELVYRGFPHWRPDTRILGSDFSPTQISDLVAWFDASQITGLNDDDPVSTWEDSSGNGNDVTEAGANRPLYKVNIVNGLPVVRFDGSNDRLNNASFSIPAQPCTFYCVMAHRSTSIVANEGYVVGDPSSVPFLFALNGASDTYAIYSGAILDTGTVLDTSFHVFGGVFNGASSEARLDGTSTGGNAGSTNGGTGLFLGSNGVPAQFSDSDIAEVAIYGKLLNATELDTLETYFSEKYNITLS